MINSDPTADWHAGSLIQLSGGYWQIFTLHTGVKLDLFTHLAQNARSAAQVSADLELDLRGTTLLLNALSAMKLLVKRGDEYTATETAATYLDKTSPDYIGHMILHHHYLVDPWHRLDEAVRGGRPLESRSDAPEEKKREAFLMGMSNIASQQAPEIASLVDLETCRNLLDLGGGPGTYAIYFCQRNPRLRATVFDRPTTRPFADETIERHGLSDRIDFVSGNFVKDSIGSTYDAVWLSHILHAEGPQVCEQIVYKVVQALRPGGTILIHDFILEDTMDGPLFPALFALNMLQATDRGQSYSQADITKMLEKAGVSRIERLAYSGPTESGIIQGFRD